MYKEQVYNNLKTDCRRLDFLKNKVPLDKRDDRWEELLTSVLKEYDPNRITEFDNLSADTWYEVALKFPHVLYFAKNRNIKLTHKQYIKIVSEYGPAIRNIPKEIIDDDIIFTAVKQSRRSVKEIKKLSTECAVSILKEDYTLIGDLTFQNKIIVMTAIDEYMKSVKKDSSKYRRVKINVNKELKYKKDIDDLVDGIHYRDCPYINKILTRYKLFGIFSTRK